MIGFDLSNITNLYVGSTPYSAIYLGSLLIWPKSHASEYLTFELIEPSQFEILQLDNADISNCSIYYSTDNGSTWTNAIEQSGGIGVSPVGVTPTFPAGTRVLWKGNLSNVINHNTPLVAITQKDYSGLNNNQLVSGRFNVSGNPASLYFGDNFVSSTTHYDYMFAYLFMDCDKLISAFNLALPLSTLSNGIYERMFIRCTSLTTPPALPATTLAPACYLGMFHDCTSLTTAPALPATNLYGASQCYDEMFMNCTSLTSAPALPATTLASSCYQYMFDGCTSLTTPPALPATTLEYSCYGGMFENCTALTTAPALPATTLTISCYSLMFYGCTALTTAPTLSAPTLVGGCYGAMFKDCTSLSSITCLATDISASLCTEDWVENVAVSGTFTKATSMNNWTTGDNGIPSGWTVQNYGPAPHDYSQDYFTLEALENGSITWTDSTNSQSIYYKTENDTNWYEFPSGYNIFLVQGEKYIFKASGLTAASSTGIGTFSSTCRFNAMGNIMSLQDGDNFTSSTTISNENQFRKLFYNCANIVDVSNLILPATTLKNYCYYTMFQGCSSLTIAPALPATTLIYGCYGYMFYGCTSLTIAPELPATTLGNSCYNGMFGGCTSLTTAPELPATALTQSCYNSMFKNCTSLTTAPELPATTLANYCYQSIFQNCTLLSSVTCLATDISATNCTRTWLDNVAASGTFTKDASMTNWPTGVNGIPSGWTVQDAS